MSIEIIQSAATELLVNVALAVLALAGAYAVYYIRLGTSKLKAQTAQIEDASTRKVLDDALEDVANLATLSVGAMEQTTAKALREAVKGGKASREELVALGKQVFDQLQTEDGRPYQEKNGHIYLEWMVPYEAGELKAVAYDEDDNVIATDVIRTSGEPAQIRLTPDREIITADGEDLSYILVEVLDEDGNLVPTAEIIQAFPDDNLNSDMLHTNGDFFEAVSFSGSHQAGLQAIVKGDVDVAPISDQILASEIANGAAAEGDVKIIHESGAIPAEAMVVAGHVDEETRQTLTNFLTGYDNEQYFTDVIKVPGARFIECDMSDYQEIIELNKIINEF